MCRRSVVSVYLLTLALLLAAVACSHKSTPSQESKAAPEKTATSAVPADVLVADMNSFGFKLFAEIVNSEFDKNILISPVSISVALQMTYNGAAGETKKAMARVLELGRLNLRGVNEASAKLLEALASPEPGVEFIIANSLWARKDIPFREEFLRRGEKYYKAYIETLDFKKPKAVDVINKWVSDNTKGKIKKLVQKIGRDDVLFLINAAYFKGGWRFKFDKAETFLRDFHLLDGRTKEVPMMKQECKGYRYLHTDKFQAISLPYGEGRFSMYIFLPDEKSSLKEFYAMLNKENWDMWISQLKWEFCTILLPRFEFRYEILLNDALKALGMGIAFDERRADFSNMIIFDQLPPGTNAYIERVKHKTFIRVDEKGTEAAAATEVAMVLSAAVSCDSFWVEVNRPFFFAIVDNETKAVLFTGSVVEP